MVQVPALVAQLGRHDKHTRGHSERVRVFSDLIADELGIEGLDRDKLRWSALLHDIGKRDVPPAPPAAQPVRAAKPAPKPAAPQPSAVRPPAPTPVASAPSKGPVSKPGASGPSKKDGAKAGGKRKGGDDDD